MKFSDFSDNIKIRLISSFFNRTISIATTPFLIIFISHIFDKSTAGTLVIVGVLLNFLSNILGGYLADIYNRKSIMLFGQISHIISILGIIFYLSPYSSINPTILVVFYLCLGFSSNLYKPAYSALIMDSTTKENRHHIYKYDYWLMNLSLALGTMLGGILYKNHLTALFIAAAIIITLLTIVLQKY